VDGVPSRVLVLVLFLQNFPGFSWAVAACMRGRKFSAPRRVGSPLVLGELLEGLRRQQGESCWLKGRAVLVVRGPSTPPPTPSLRMTRSEVKSRLWRWQRRMGRGWREIVMFAGIFTCRMRSIASCRYIADHTWTTAGLFLKRWVG